MKFGKQNTILLAILLSLVVGKAETAQAFTTTNTVVGAGTGIATGGSFSTSATACQTHVGVVSSGANTSQIGFWYGLNLLPPVPQLPEIILGLNAYSDTRGLVEVRDNNGNNYDHVLWRRVPWSYYNSRNGETRVATGDLDGDGLDEVVVGLGSGSNGRLYVFDDKSTNYASLGWITLPWNRRLLYGAMMPAVGDLDGDGKAEIVVGASRTPYLAIFDDAGTGFAYIRSKKVGYRSPRPAVGDLDGDGRAEIVVGFGYRPRGLLLVIDDANTGYRSLRWLRVPAGEYNYSRYVRSYVDRSVSYWFRATFGYYWRRYYNRYTLTRVSNPFYNGETRPAMGDVDGDGKAEIVVGLGSGGRGKMYVFDDNFSQLGWISVPFSAYADDTSWAFRRRSFRYYSWRNRTYMYYHFRIRYLAVGSKQNGETWPAVGDLDGDGKAEILAGLGNKGKGLIAVFDDAANSYSFVKWLRIPHRAYSNAVGASQPAIGNIIRETAQ